VKHKSHPKYYLEDLEKMWINGDTYILLVEMLSGIETIFKKVLMLFRILKRQSPYETAIPFLIVYPYKH
jgi:hypothetical protein